VVRRLGRGIIRVVTRHPVLVLTFVALLLRFGWPLVTSGFQDGLVGYIWTASSLWLDRSHSSPHGSIRIFPDSPSSWT
jgi:hypothetical protein